MRKSFAILAALPILAFCGCPADSTGTSNDVVNQDTATQNDTAVQEDTTVQEDVAPLPCVQTPTDTWIDCPGNLDVGFVTGIQALNKLQPMAVRILGPDPLWIASLMGFSIRQDGTAGPVPPSKWYTGFCKGLDEVDFQTQEGACHYRMICGTATCWDTMTHAFPKVDTDTAIATAFPDGAADAVYSVNLSYMAASGWRITDSRNTTVTVDPDNAP